MAPLLKQGDELELDELLVVCAPSCKGELEHQQRDGLELQQRDELELAHRRQELESPDPDINNYYPCPPAIHPLRPGPRRYIMFLFLHTFTYLYECWYW